MSCPFPFWERDRLGSRPPKFDVHALRESKVIAVRKYYALIKSPLPSTSPPSKDLLFTLPSPPSPDLQVSLKKRGKEGLGIKDLPDEVLDARRV